MTIEYKKNLTLAGLLGLMILNPLNNAAVAQPLANIISQISDPAPAVAPEKVISIDLTKNNDKKIETRLREIFSELDDLKGVKVSVRNGVVSMDGQVETSLAAERAQLFAGQTENVVEVKNQIIINHNLKKRIQRSFEKMLTIGEGLVAGFPLFLAALFIFFMFWLVGKWFSLRKSVYRRISVNYFIVDLLAKLTHLFFIVMGIITALTLLDATALIGTFLGAAGIFGLAIGFAVKDTVENFITSLLLSIRNPFEVNEFVNIDGHEGSVARLTSRATILISPDNNHIRIPNSVVFKAVIINYSRNPERRFQFDIGVDAWQDLLIAQGLAIKTLMSVPGVLAEPEPLAIIEELGNSNVLLRIYGWVDQSAYNFMKVRSETIRLVKEAFDAANIVMPEPIYNIKITKDLPGVAGDKAEIKTVSQKLVESEMVKHQTDQIKNITIDRNIENQINKENAQRADQNLLDPSASSEM
ncbi:MAG: mechanosensitive ion channel family protein [Methylococcaceae bacterium]|jgi:small-conductance mechanosensitive channel